MEKAIVIGCPGSGKSTFARALRGKTELPLHYLDMLYWNEDKSTVPREEFLRRLDLILEKDRWIIDGNYPSSMPRRIVRCDTVFFLDYPVELCLEGVRMRMNRPREDMPWIETEEDAELMELIRSFENESRLQIIKLLEENTDKDIKIFKSRGEADEYLEKLQ